VPQTSGYERDDGMALNERTILVAEDEPDQLEYLSSVLEDEGATVIKAHNGNEALELARTHQPDLVTLDIQMPGMDAAAVLREFSEDVNLVDICLCLISGRPELRLILMDKHDGRCVGFVDKPFSPGDLITKVEGLLEI